MIKVVTDMTSSLPDNILEEYGITSVPTYVTFGTETFRDRVDITPQEFYQRLESSKELPTTSQPSVADFDKVYRKLADEGATTILSIHFSEALSGTIASGRQAASKLPGVAIRIFDTRSISLGEGLMVLQAARMVRANEPEADIIKKLEHMRDHTRVYFTLDTLEYLAKGGRIGRAARFMGSLMNMKPILRIHNGALEPHSRHISRGRAVDALRALALDDKQPGMHLGVIHADREDEARELAEEMRVALKPEVLLIGDVGAAISTHGGPGSLGLIWYTPGEKTS